MSTAPLPSRVIPYNSAELALKVVGKMSSIATNPNCTLIPSLIDVMQRVTGMNQDNFLPWSSSFDRGSSFSGIQCANLTTRVAVWGLTPKFHLYLVVQYVVSVNGSVSHREAITLYALVKCLSTNALIAMGADHKQFSFNLKTIARRLEALLSGETLRYNSTNVDTFEKTEYSFSVPTQEQILSLKIQNTVSLLL